MAYKPPNHQEMVIFELYINRKQTRCVACREFLNVSNLREKGPERVVTERTNDLFHKQHDYIEDFHLVHFGCKRTSKRNEYAGKAIRMKEGGKSHREIAEHLDLSLATIYNYLKDTKKRVGQVIVPEPEEIEPEEPTETFPAFGRSSSHDDFDP